MHKKVLNDFEWLNSSNEMIQVCVNLILYDQTFVKERGGGVREHSRSPSVFRDSFAVPQRNAQHLINLKWFDLRWMDLPQEPSELITHSEAEL